MLMNYARACNPYSGFSAPVNGTNAIGYAEKALFSGLSRHISHYGLRIKDGRKIDPACGSGNFLTETYLSLRDLEDQATLLKQGAFTALALDGYHVKITNFYGIEINDFAVSVDKTVM